MVEVYQAVDETLLLLAEARERAERAAKEALACGAPEHLVAAFERIDHELLAMHRGLMDDALGAPKAAETQLALEAA